MKILRTYLPSWCSWIQSQRQQAMIMTM
ncbi:hypothetical protein DRO66_00335 [Candidatus Bathyarchaeota archaeon]|nr:MAG: hypothetical protein DRO66_00335 [Candidatus Bathyarchaeota archaeon]